MNTIQGALALASLNRSLTLEEPTPVREKECERGRERESMRGGVQEEENETISMVEVDKVW